MNVDVGFVDPDNRETQSVLEGLVRRGFKVRRFLISHASFAEALKYYKLTPLTARESPTGTVVLSEFETTRQSLSSFAQFVDMLDERSRTTTDLLELLLGAGLILNASDVHIEPQESGAHIRFRVDGVLQPVTTVERGVYEQLINRVKVVAHIPLNVRDVAHDGRFTIQTSSFEAEVRVSLLPGAFGEYLVLRLLNPTAISLEVDELGMETDLWEPLKGELSRPNGIILTTGPTGSGKTTTLYAFLKYLKSPDIKIVTLEDPIEYHLGGISQSQIDPKHEHTFAEALKSTLRHDPDIILVGEIRDDETAQTALNASLTGHLVLSTLHTNDAAGAIPRFLDLNAKPAILASALRAVIAQRLVRRLCEECKSRVSLKKEREIRATITEAFSANSARLEELGHTDAFYEARGCSACSSTGYRGRVGIYEIIIMESELERLVGSSPSHREVLDYLYARGFETMYQNGLRKVSSGITSIEEVSRVAGTDA
jgi:type II secretory ATPase GspE/PulE/Tfp pilus assembly ATPase PilB-like protein